MKREKRVTIYTGGHDELKGNLQEVITWLEKKLIEIPKEYRSTTRIDIQNEYVDYSDNQEAVVYIDYYRPETDEEEAERVAAEFKKKEYTRAKQLEQLEYLKKQLGIE